MPQEVRDKAFDAFFTTKHRGTGLGLPIARRVVEAHGGSIQIDVPPAGGTTISIDLPLPRAYELIRVAGRGQEQPSRASPPPA